MLNFDRHVMYSSLSDILSGLFWAQTVCNHCQQKTLAGKDLIAFNIKAQVSQCSHRLEKYLNIQDCLEMSLKIKFALKGT